MTHPPLPSTDCDATDWRAVSTEALATSKGFAAWFGSAQGRAWLANEFRAHKDCYNKLTAVDRIRRSWAEDHSTPSKAD